MKEVAVKIKFITPCLGGIRRPDYDRFERDGSGAVIFMASWWRRILVYGAKAFGKHQKLVRQVRMNSRIEGHVQRFKRFYAANRWTEHEAFMTGDEIVIRAMLPNGLPPNEFRTIINLAGEYRGISPYGWQDGYGRFEVSALTQPAPFAKADHPAQEES